MSGKTIPKLDRKLSVNEVPTPPIVSNPLSVSTTRTVVKMTSKATTKTPESQSGSSLKGTQKAK